MQRERPFEAVSLRATKLTLATSHTTMLPTTRPYSPLREVAIDVQPKRHPTMHCHYRPAPIFSENGQLRQPALPGDRSIPSLIEFTSGKVASVRQIREMDVERAADCNRYRSQTGSRSNRCRQQRSCFPTSNTDYHVRPSPSQSVMYPIRVVCRLTTMAAQGLWTWWEHVLAFLLMADVSLIVLFYLSRQRRSLELGFSSISPTGDLTVSLLIVAAGLTGNGTTFVHWRNPQG